MIEHRLQIPLESKTQFQRRSSSSGLAEVLSLFGAPVGGDSHHEVVGIELDGKSAQGLAASLAELGMPAPTFAACGSQIRAAEDGFFEQ